MKPLLLIGPLIAVLGAVSFCGADDRQTPPTTMPFQWGPGTLTLGKLAKPLRESEKQPINKGGARESGDVEVNRSLVFDKFENTDRFGAVVFILDTGGFDWQDGLCVHDGEFCKDFCSILGMPDQQLVGSNSDGVRYTTVSKAVDNGEVFVVVKGQPFWDLAIACLKRGELPVKIKTNEGELGGSATLKLYIVPIALGSN